MDELTEENIRKLHKAGFVLKTDTLLSLRELSGLTQKAMAAEMGMKLYQYDKFERGVWKPKFIHLKAALMVVRLLGGTE